MLNGISPILIIAFKKVFGTDTQVGVSIPLLSEQKIFVPLVPIPIYFDEGRSGLGANGIYIQSISKNIDIQTEIDGDPEGKKAKVTQKPLNSVITIEAFARTDSLGLNILLALADVMFTKTVSQEYNVSFLSGAMNVFGGLLESLSVVQNSDNNLYKVSMQITNAPAAGAAGTVAAADPVTIPAVDGATLGGNVA